jgi:hypothetical protein
MRRGYLAAALAAGLGAGPALAQFDLPLSRPAAKDLDDPKPVYKYELKPEHGQYFVCVKTFRGAAAGDRQVKELAEGLAEYIRSECRLYAYVHERGWGQRQERKKEKAAAIAAIRAYYEPRGETEEQIAARIRREVKLARIPDEYAVLVAPGKGTLKTMDDALEFAKYVRKLPAPPAAFCDAVVIGTDRDIARKQGDPVNPFLTALAGPNPTIPKAVAAAAPVKADEFLLGINAGQPYSLIHQTKKPVTLVVKIYGAEAGHLVRPGEVMQATGRSDGAMLERIAQQAHALAKALRAMRYDAYVLHTRYESFVCVGEYDSKDDAELLANARALASLPLKKEKTGEVLETLMEKPLPAAIPRP